MQLNAFISFRIFKERSNQRLDKRERRQYLRASSELSLSL